MYTKLNAGVCFKISINGDGEETQGHSKLVIKFTLPQNLLMKSNTSKQMWAYYVDVFVWNWSIRLEIQSFTWSAYVSKLNWMAMKRLKDLFSKYQSSDMPEPDKLDHEIRYKKHFIRIFLIEVFLGAERPQVCSSTPTSVIILQTSANFQYWDDLHTFKLTNMPTNTFSAIRKATKWFPIAMQKAQIYLKLQQTVLYQC